MIFAFIGAHGSEKSELAKKLCSDLQNLHQPTYLLENVASKLREEEGLPLLDGTTVSAQTRILQEQTRLEIEVTSSLEYRHLISVGAPLSHYAYFKHIVMKNQDKEESKRMKAMSYNLDNIVRNWMNTYNYIFKLAPKKNSDIFMKEINKEIEWLLRDFKIDHISLYNMDRPKWYEIVKEKIELSVPDSTGKIGATAQ